MWTSWALIGLCQIYTNRYLRHKWRWAKLVHALLGFLAMALVVTAGFLALNAGGWSINGDSSLHSIVGFIGFILGLLLMVGGITANIIRQKVSLPW